MSSCRRCICISLVVCIIFVDGIVSKVDERIVECFQFVFLGGKACQAFPENKDSKWVHISDKNINTEVKLMFINKIWVLDILLHNKVLIGVNLIESFGYENTLTLRHSFWFHDEVGAALPLPAFLPVVPRLATRQSARSNERNPKVRASAAHRLLEGRVWREARLVSDGSGRGSSCIIHSCPQRG